MSSATYIAAAKTAIEICNTKELKREILYSLWSDLSCKHTGIFQFPRKKQWNEKIVNKATIILENLGIARQLHEKEINLAFLVAMRMLTWAEYHEGVLGFSRTCSFDFFNDSIFTEKGIIDDKKAAEELMKSEHLSTAQKYKLACLNCSKDHIGALHRQMSKEDRDRFYDADTPERIKQPELVKFWSYYLMDEIDKLKGDTSLDQYRLEKAVGSGSKAAVEYCLEQTKLRKKKGAIVDAAVEAVRCITNAGPYTEADWTVFRNPKYTKRKESWVPTTYYVDIVYFLLSKMGKDQQIEFLKLDLEGTKYKSESLGNIKHSRVLRYFLDWPYLDYFMEKANLMWEFLPENDYVMLLLKICDKIYPKEDHLNYGQEKIYNYKELFIEFWNQSPERYRRFVCSNQIVNCKPDRLQHINAGEGLIIKLLSLINFAFENVEILKLILESATSEEKENILSSEECRKACIRHIGDENWGALTIFILNCFSSREEGDKFRRELSFTAASKSFCIYYVKTYRWLSAEAFIRWSSLPEEEINKLKKQMIYSLEGKTACVDFISTDEKVETADEFIRWFLSSEEVAAFKKELIFSPSGTGKCSDLVTGGQLELVSEFINFCLSSEEDIRELKKNVAYSFGGRVCKVLISDNGYEAIYHSMSDEIIGRKIIFKGGKWEEVEKFLTWCFSSEEEISDFKKNELLKNAGNEIHFNLIKSNQFEEAETFFAWLGLSAEEVKNLKKDTLFSYYPAHEMFSKMMYTGDEGKYADYGGKQEAIELFSRWYLTDKETVHEFNDEFRRKYQPVNEEERAVCQKVALMIEQRLKDLNEQEI